MTDFTNAKDLYFKKIAMPTREERASSGYHRGLRITGNNNKRPIFDINKPLSTANQPESKYARAARLGLCFKCMREDENPDHRPRHRVFAYCKECDEDFAIGTEKLVIKAQNEVNRWFKD